MLTIEQAQIELEKCVDSRELFDAAKHSGIGYQTLWRIARKKHSNVTLGTLKKLSAYLEAKRNAGGRNGRR